VGSLGKVRLHILVYILRNVSNNQVTFVHSLLSGHKAENYYIILHNLRVNHFVKRKLDVVFRDETIKTENQDISERWRYLLASDWYCSRAGAVIGTVMPTVRQVTVLH
jgi:Na+/H+ antiporter NhaB